MESIPLEMDDIFDEEDDVEDFSPSRLPDLEDELEPMRDARSDDDRDNAGNAQVETENAELLSKLKSMKGASKNITRKTMPKLDVARLIGERGIPILPKVFSDVPLKGKNHEKEDLNIIMKTLEHWAHRLFPKMTFGEVLERAERLGAKKEVQNCVKRIRLDMPVLASDMVQDDDDDDDVQRTGGKDKENSVQRNEESFMEQEIEDDEVEELLRDQTLPVSSICKPDNAASQLNVQTKPVLKNGLTDELKARIEQNKKLALERRAAKLGQVNQDNLLCQQPNIMEKVTAISPEHKSPQRLSQGVSELDGPTCSNTLNNNADRPTCSKSLSTDTDRPTCSKSLSKNTENSARNKTLSSATDRQKCSYATSSHDRPTCSKTLSSDTLDFFDSEPLEYEDSMKEKTSCVEPATDLQTDKLFPEDSDSDMPMSGDD